MTTTGTYTVIIYSFRGGIVSIVLKVEYHKYAVNRNEKKHDFVEF